MEYLIGGAVGFVIGSILTRGIMRKELMDLVAKAKTVIEDSQKRNAESRAMHEKLLRRMREEK